MGRRLMTLLCWGAVCLVLGCSRAELVPIPDQLTLYSIDGSGSPRSKEAPKSDEEFHGYPVLGKVDISTESDRQSLVTALNQGIAEGSEMSKCFWPRHGIRMVSGGETKDYVICFECLQFALHSGENKDTYAISTTPQSVFNQYLTDAGVELAPSALSQAEAE